MRRTIFIPLILLLIEAPTLSAPGPQPAKALGLPRAAVTSNRNGLELGAYSGPRNGPRGGSRSRPAETGVFRLLFLDLSYDEAKQAGRLRIREDLDEAIVHGAVKRARPKMMTVFAAFMGLLPIMWSTATGADAMKRPAGSGRGGLKGGSSC